MGTFGRGVHVVLLPYQCIQSDYALTGSFTFSPGMLLLHACHVTNYTRCQTHI